MNPQPLIAVREVEVSTMWYQAVLGCQSGHGGFKHERLIANHREVWLRDPDGYIVAIASAYQVPMEVSAHLIRLSGKVSTVLIVL